MIGDNVRRIRNNKGFSMDKIREITGLSKSTISELETNKSNPTTDTLQKIADALDVDIKNFYENEANTDNKTKDKEFDLGTVKLNRIARSAQDLTESDQEVVLNVIEAMRKAKGENKRNYDKDKI